MVGLGKIEKKMPQRRDGAGAVCNSGMGIFAGAARRAGPDSILILCEFVSVR